MADQAEPYAESVGANVTDPEMRGRVSERALIVAYLIGAGEEALAKQIEYGYHTPPPIPPPARTDGSAAGGSMGE